MENTHYEVLGISPEATQDKIKNAYRVQAMKWHPDKNHGSPESEEHFKRIAAAYTIAKQGSSYVITTGLFLFGGINLLRALYYLISGRAPS